jgi:hypothetical protein
MKEEELFLIQPRVLQRSGFVPQPQRSSNFLVKNGPYGGSGDDIAVVIVFGVVDGDSSMALPRS